MAESGSRRLVGDKTSDWLARRKSSAGHAQLASWRAKEVGFPRFEYGTYLIEQLEKNKLTRIDF